MNNAKINKKGTNTHKDLLKSSILKIQEKDRRIRELESERDEPIAIIGMSCRFPGAPDPEAFWQLIKNGDDAITIMSNQRWDMDNYFSAVSAEPGKINTRHFGLLEAVDQFDPAAFGISEAEAPYIDPQHRLLLEQAWFCFERAGLDIAAVKGTGAGVFIGQMNSDYTRLLKSTMDLNAYIGQGNALSAAAGRLSYAFGLTGPSISVDTACSSSLVTVHLACQSLRLGECSVALAGGVNLLLSPEAAIGASVASMLSATGRCNTFGDAADGYVRSEGCGMVLLKTLVQAEADGDRILAVIRGSAINQDGRSHGLNAPNGPAQMEVMRRALAHARVTPSQVGYLEAHGTGTSLGDPVEVQAIDAVYGRVKDRSEALTLGAVKANIGHCESAAGIAGLIKLVLLVQHDVLPPITHLDKLNPHLEGLSEHLVFPRNKAQSWNTQQPRIAALSSFGYTGTNVHLILAHYVSTAKTEVDDSSGIEDYPFYFSAHSAGALRGQLALLVERLMSTPDISLRLLAATVNRTQNTLAYRFGVQARTHDELLSHLLSGAHRKFSELLLKPAVVLCFGCSALVSFRFSATFASASWSSRYQKLQEDLEQLTGMSLETLSRSQDHPILSLMVIQLLNAERLVSQGGQSQKIQAQGTGIVAALVFAGVLRFEQAVRLCFSMQQSSGTSLSEDERQQLIDRLDLAEAQRQVFVSGNGEKKSAWLQWPHDRPTDAKIILGEMLIKVSDKPFVAWPLQQTELGIELSQLTVFTETPVRPAVTENADKNVDAWVGLGVALFNRGLSLISETGSKGPKNDVYPLPDYFFDRRRYWLPEQITARVSSLPLMFSPVQHGVFTTELTEPNGSSLFAGELSLARLPFLRDHVVAGEIVVPASMYFDMIAEVCSLPSGAPARVTDMQIMQACVLNIRPVAVYCRVSGTDTATAKVDIYTRVADSDVWRKHVSASVELYTELTVQSHTLATDRNECTLPVAVDKHLAKALQAGIEYGESFQAIRQLFRGTGVALAKIKWPASLASQWSGRGLHPVLLDACFQVISGAIADSANEDDISPLFVPTKIHGLEDTGHRPKALWCFVRILGPTPRWESDTQLHDYLREREQFAVSLHAYDEQGQQVINIERFEASRYQPNLAVPAWADWLLEKHWIVLPSLTSALTISADDLWTQTRVHVEAAQYVMDAGVLEDLDALSGHYIRDAFSQLGLAQDTRLTLDDVMQHHGVLPSYHRLVQRLLFLRSQLPTTELSGKTLESRLRTKLGTETRELDLLVRCGEALADVLSGQTKAVDLLFAPDKSEVAEAVYQDSAGSLALNDQIAALVAQAAICLPQGHRLRVLEVGAGTGATTRQVLKQVEGLAVDYVFSDLSEHFLTRAKHNFQDTEAIDYQLFDLHLDPCSQGFTAGQFDLIIGVNVLHATSDLRRTLNHLSVCLADGGMLLLRELTQPLAWLDLTFGLTAGWWNFTDVDLRQESPLLDTCEWEKLLSDCGFESTLATDEPARTESIFVAKKIAQCVDQITLESKGCYVVFADEDSGTDMQWLATLKQDIEVRGQSLVMISSDEALNHGCLQHCDDFSARLTEIEKTNGTITDIVYAWSLCPVDLTVTSLLDASCLYLKYPLLLCQALLHSRWRHLYPSFLTAGAQPLENKVTQPLQAMLWGHVFTYINENATFARLIDLDPSTVVGQILCDALAQTDECQLVIRDGQMRAARLRRASLSVPDASVARSQIVAHASYLITGGFGDLGLQTAKALAEQGAKHLILIGRSVRKDAEPTLNDLRRQGVQVVPVYVDISDEVALNIVLKDALAELPPLRGVVHSVGVLEDGVIEQQSWERYLRVLQPKVFGAIHLYRSVLDCTLDFFVIYSSASAVMGNPGQANHAAANAFLDAFAWYLRGIQRPGLSIAWGAWSDIGAAAALDMTARLSDSGSIAGTIDPKQGMAVIEQQFACENVQFTVLPLQHRQSLDAEHLPQVQRLLAQLLDEVGSVIQTPLKVSHTVGTFGAEDFLQRLQPMGVPARRREMEAYLQTMLVKLLRHSGAIEPHASLFDHGLDSLLVIDLRGLLERHFAQKFESTLLYDYPSIAELTEFLLKCLPASHKAATSAPVTVPDPLPAHSNEEGYGGAIAVVGMSCRFPGGANSPQQFWELLKEGVDTVKAVPAERWDHAKYYDPDRTKQGKIYVAKGCFVDQVDQFCPERFAIAGIEAELMDPQQRMLLDVSYEALESAGLDPMALTGSETGVFVGVMTQDYLQLTQHVREHAFYVGTGAANSIISGRISHVFGLMGPTMTLDTACSSSLVSVQLACTNLRTGACDMALAGGVSLQLSPEPLIIECAGGMLSPNGSCRTFDASADGFVRGEGCGVVVLKRLADAEKEGDPIIGVIRGGAVTHDGRAGGLTVPNGLSQQRVLEKALQDAGVSPAEISYIEAHGTGTHLGDPMELNALQAVFGESHREASIYVGSVKTNIGHAEAAAGIAGLIKVLLCLQHGKLAPHLHFEQPNPNFDWQQSGIEVNDILREWTSTQPKRAGVSSFGLSGTNAHLVVEEHASAELSQDITADFVPLAVLTHINREQLQHDATRYLQALTECPMPVVDVAYTFCTSRAGQSVQAILPAGSISELIDGLQSLCQGKVLISEKHAVQPQLVWRLAATQVPQWGDQTANYYTQFTAFRQVIDDCAKALRRRGFEVTSARVLCTSECLEVPVSLHHAILGLAYGRLLLSLGVAPEQLYAKGLMLLSAAALSGAASIETMFAGLLAENEDELQVTLSAVDFARSELTITFIADAHIPAAFNQACSGVCDKFYRKDSPTDANNKNEMLLDLLLGVIGVQPCGALHQLLAALSHQGQNINWKHYFAFAKPRKVVLPSSLFPTHRYWVTDQVPKEIVPSLITNDVTSAGDGRRYVEFDLDVVQQSFLGEHCLDNTNVFPAAGSLALVVHAMASTCGVSLNGMRFLRPLQFEQQLLVQLEVFGDGRAQLYSRESATKAWQSFATIDALAVAQPAEEAGLLSDTDELLATLHFIRDNATFTVDKQAFYNTYIPKELRLGDSYRRIERIWRDGQSAVAKIHTLSADFMIDPQVLDTCLQLVNVLGDTLGIESDGLFLPYGIRRVAFNGWPNGLYFWCLAQYLPDQSSADELVYDISIMDENEQLCARFEQVSFRKVTHFSSSLPTELDKVLLQHVTWQASALPSIEPGNALLNVLLIGRENSSQQQLQVNFQESMQSIWCDDIAKNAQQKIQAILDFHQDAQALIYTELLGVSDVDASLPAYWCEGAGDALWHLAQWLISASDKNLPVIVLTQFSQNIDPEDTLSSGAAFAAAALVQTVTLEFPSLRVVLVDVDKYVSDVSQIPIWLAEVISEKAEPVVAYRQGQRYLRRLESIPLSEEVAESDVTPTIHRERTYVISGGLGDIGLLTAEKLVAEGANALALLARSERPDTDLRVAALRALGCQVRVLIGDISHLDHLREQMDIIAREMPPVAGILHSAGTLSNALLKQQSEIHWQSVLSAKVKGALNLYELSKPMSLDFFVLFSSIASIGGSVGQANYVVANGLLDYLARRWASQGVPAMSINWGAWENTGMAGQAEARGVAFEQRLTSEQALTSLSLLLRQPMAQVVCYRDDEDDAVSSDIAPSGTALGSDFYELTTDEQRQVVVQVIHNGLMDFLKIEASQVLDERPFFDFGMDSITAVDFSYRISEAFALELHVDTIFDYPTMITLAEHILQLLHPDEQVQTPKESVSIDDISKMLELELEND